MATRDLDELAWIFRSISYRKRLEILNLLVKKGPLTVTDISKEIVRNLPATSQHLAVLARAGFVKSKKMGTFVWYRIKKGKFSARQIIMLWLIIDSFDPEGKSAAVEGIAKKILTGEILGPFRNKGRM